MKTIAFYSIKGGVGKTASCVNIAYLAAEAGKRTLLCDLDPQGASSYYLKVRPKKSFDSTKLIKGGKDLRKSIRESDFTGLDVIPSDLSLRMLDIELSEKKNSQKRLSKTLSDFSDEYDLIILDCPPNITLLSENIIEASDLMFVPMIPTVLSELTYEKLVKHMKGERISESMLYTFFSLADRRKSLHKQTIAEFTGRKHSLSSVIPYCSDVEKMGLYREPVLVSAGKSKGAVAYRKLWKEMEPIIWKR